MNMDTCWFWHWILGGAVKIRLRKGQMVWHKSGGDIDEGFHYEQCMWSFDGEFVSCRIDTHARDCDGLMETHWGGHCHVGALRQGNESTEEKGVIFPRWIKASSSQRDYSAEAAGY